MNGIRMVRTGRNIDNARSDDIILDSSLESLPIHWQGEFDLRVLPAAADFGKSSVLIPHNLGYIPMAFGWVDYDLSNGTTVRAKMPAFSQDNWLYSLRPRIDGVLIQAVSGAFDPSAQPNFRRKGYVYIIAKDLSRV